MHTTSINGSDTWILQEKVVYNFQQQTMTRRNNGCTTLLEQQPPSIIILSLWPQATTEQVKHYTAGYACLYPTAKVVLLHNHIPPFNNDDAIYESALDQIEMKQCSRRQQTVLLHLFGTSGAAGACKLLRRYNIRTAGPLNVGAVVADTEPSSSLTSLLTSSHPISTAFYTVLAAFWMSLQVLILFWQQMDSPVQIHQDLKNPSLLPSEARKCFVFAQRGLMLTWTKRRLASRPNTSYTSALKDELCSNNVESCDEQDERREVSIRRSSIGQKGRWSGDQERYWSGIEGVWSGR